MLAIKGGPMVKETPFPKQVAVGDDEREAVNALFRGGKPLSSFRGNWQPEFWGGEQVQAFEREWERTFVSYSALAVNSCTSALQIACGAAGIQPGDEVIVTPWSMTCSATAPLVWGGVPVFADIEPTNFCLDPDDVERKITVKTKAIIAVSLFGQPFDPRLRDIAKKYDLILIEDAAQAPGARCDGEHTGNLGDMGCFSFTAGKHLTCGEGGILTARTENLKYRGALIRNHAESVIHAMSCGGVQDAALGTVFSETPNMVGYNMRMTELNAAIMREQLKKLPAYIEMRQVNAWKIYEGIKDIPCIINPGIRENCSHVYYVQPFLYDQDATDGIHRDAFVDAVQAELAGETWRADRPMMGKGYIKPLYMMPLFQGCFHFAFDQHHIAMKNNPSRTYREGSCPTCEDLWRDKFFLSMYHNLPLTDDDIKAIIDAYHKVWENRKELTGEQ